MRQSKYITKTGKQVNLYSDPWVPVTGRSSMASLQDLLEEGDRYVSINASPMTRLAIIRLLQALRVCPSKTFEYFDLDVFLQIGGLPPGGRSPQDIIDMVDGNSVAFSPKDDRPVSDSVMAQAVLSAYSCDRAGLKARMPGLPIAGQMPAHVGRDVKLKRGASVAELLDNNPIEAKGEYQPPWITGFLEMPKHDVPRDQLELIMWPWRRVQILDQKIAIAPGAPVQKSVTDPSAGGKSKLFDRSAAADPDFEVTHLVLNKALPIACWIS